MDYAPVAEQSGSGRRYDSSAEGSNVAADTIKEVLERTLLSRQKVTADSAL